METERNITAVLLALISGAVVADFLTHGQVTTTLATTFISFLGSGLKIAAGQTA